MSDSGNPVELINPDVLGDVVVLCEHASNRVPEGYDAANGYTANDQPGELYDLAADLGQRRNLYGTKPGKVSELQALLAQVRAKGQVR